MGQSIKARSVKAPRVNSLNIVNITPNSSVVTGLENILKAAKEEMPQDCTIIMNGEVYHLGCVDDAKAASDAVFNMTYGIHKLMSASIDY